MVSVSFWGKLYVLVVSIYFVVSGLNTLFNIDTKLARIGLEPVSEDGKIAFILIYCGLMVGIGVAMALLFFVSRSWVYSVWLGTIIIAAFVCFRLIGMLMLSFVSDVQISFLFFELIEVAVGVLIIWKS